MKRVLVTLVLCGLCAAAGWFITSYFLGRENDALREQLGVIEGEVNDTVDTVTILQGGLLKTCSALNIVSNTLAEATTALDSQRIVNQQLRGHIERLTASEVSLKAKADMAHLANSTVIKREKQMARELGSAKELLAAVQKHNADIAKELAQNSSAAKSAASELAKVKSDLLKSDADKGELSKQLSSLQLMLKSQEGELQKLRAQVAESESKAAAGAKQLELSHSRINELAAKAE